MDNRMPLGAMAAPQTNFGGNFQRPLWEASSGAPAASPFTAFTAAPSHDEGGKKKRDASSFGQSASKKSCNDEPSDYERIYNQPRTHHGHIDDDSENLPPIPTNLGWGIPKNPEHIPFPNAQLPSFTLPGPRLPFPQLQQNTGGMNAEMSDAARQDAGLQMVAQQMSMFSSASTMGAQPLQQQAAPVGFPFGQMPQHNMSSSIAMDDSMGMTDVVGMEDQQSSAIGSASDALSGWESEGGSQVADRQFLAFGTWSDEARARGSAGEMWGHLPCLHACGSGHDRVIGCSCLHCRKSDGKYL
uniref:Uncharacterized protein n=1 Tax=Chromera velia CCMP2878 TaxID=1169474 RepID=A0A0G4HIA0_9ALVE|eukprot:Cvel_27771.t1-p1 / transcript=Cvel_27771.t1 / gene=Cvel_27771 / organism=Chromera_velia_CCMP2878 / gene_product=hypothetical protein / transcript_product=hypothetical protein / location=Cvel_scaffold3521:12386-13809(-) / protein_length=299 / sequence_SO=supercontig / SO=protein_coding / is_pseudo=false